MHQRYVQYHIASLCEARSPICLLNVQTILEAKTGFSIYQVRHGRDMHGLWPPPFTEWCRA